MTIKINVGVNKKIGLPDYGSAGGHCNIEIEADNSILDITGTICRSCGSQCHRLRLSPS